MKNCLCWGKATPAQPLPGRVLLISYPLFRVSYAEVPFEGRGLSQTKNGYRRGTNPRAEWARVRRESPREANTESAVDPSTQLGAEGKRDYRPALGRRTATVSPGATLT